MTHKTDTASWRLKEKKIRRSFKRNHEKAMANLFDKKETA